MNPFLEKGEPIERNFEPILKLYQNWLSNTEKLYHFDTAFIQTESMVCNHSVAMYGIDVVVWHFSLITYTPRRT